MKVACALYNTELERARWRLSSQRACDLRHQFAWLTGGSRCDSFGGCSVAIWRPHVHNLLIRSLHSLKNLMFLSPLTKRQNSTLKYWRLYRIQLLKWSSWRHFNLELEAPGQISFQYEGFRLHTSVRLQSHRRVTN